MSSPSHSRLPDADGEAESHTPPSASSSRLPDADGLADDMPRSPAGPAVVAGAEIAGFRVQRVLRVDDPWTVARGVPATAGVATSDASVTLWISTEGAAQDDVVAAHVRRLARLRSIRDVPHLPLVVPLTARLDRGRLVLAWPAIAGMTLAERLADGPLPSPQAVRVVSQIAGALDTLHAFGAPHGPVTPERILLTAARPTEALLLPDAEAGGPLSHAADVQGLASVLAACLETVPPELEPVLAQASDQRPGRRYRSAAAFARSVQRAAGRQRARIVVVGPPAADGPAATAPAASSRTAGPRGSAAPRHARGPRRVAALRARLAPPRIGRPWPWRTPSRGTVALLLAAAATAGFAVAVVANDDGAQQSAPPPAASVPAATAGSPARADAARARALTAALRTLDARRARGRRALAAARTPAAQARAATGLATTYGTARRAAERARAADRAILAAPLGRAEAAYGQLATAARTHDASAYASATDAVTGAERDVAAALSRLGG